MMLNKEGKKIWQRNWVFPQLFVFFKIASPFHRSDGVYIELVKKT